MLTKFNLERERKQTNNSNRENLKERVKDMKLGYVFQKFHILLIPFEKTNKLITTKTSSCIVANAAMEKSFKTRALSLSHSLCDKNPTSHKPFIALKPTLMELKVSAQERKFP